MGDQFRKAYPDQANDDRAGRRNHRIPIRRQAPHIFPQRAGHDVRPCGDLVNIVKANAQETFQNLLPADLPLELSVQGRRRKGDFVFELLDHRKRVGLGVLGVVIAYADAFAAVDAALVNNMCPSAAHPNGLGGAALQTVGASHAFFPIQTDRVKSAFIHGGYFLFASSGLFPFRPINSVRPFRQYGTPYELSCLRPAYWKYRSCRRSASCWASPCQRRSPDPALPRWR